jgi:hypothetical protein
VPGEFGSFGHDYRADMVRFVRDAYALPAASDAQLDRIDQQLRSLELERSQRIKAEHAHAAPQPPTPRTGPPARTQLPASRSAPDAPKEPGGSEADDKTSRHPPLPSEDGSLTIYVQEQPPGAATTNGRWTPSRSSPPIAKAMGRLERQTPSSASSRPDRIALANAW